jgi:hypothetical protein
VDGERKVTLGVRFGARPHYWSGSSARSTHGQADPDMNYVGLRKVLLDGSSGRRLGFPTPPRSGTIAEMPEEIVTSLDKGCKRRCIGATTVADVRAGPYLRVHASASISVMPPSMLNAPLRKYTRPDRRVPPQAEHASGPPHSPRASRFG